MALRAALPADGTLGGFTAAALRALDVEVELATGTLGAVSEIASALYPIDPRPKRAARQLNAHSVRAAVRWVRRGGALLVFPAGEVARLRLRTLRVSDPRWPASVGALVRLSGAAVIPLYVEGRNSAVFLGASLLYRPLGTLLLAQELHNKRGTRLRMHLGTPRPAELLARCGSDADLTAYLRLQCERSFRAVGEGTGRDIDCDLYDSI